MRSGRGHWLTVLASVVPLVASAIVYFPITHSYFFADDFFDFVRFVDVGWRHLLSPMAGHLLLTRRLVGSTLYTAFGIDASKYFWVVFANHLLNVWLTFYVLQSLTERRDLACLGAALWGTSPVYAESLTWFAVYGQVLSVTALLLVLAALVPYARSGMTPRASTVIGCSIALLLGATCFGTGLGIAMVTPMALLVMVPSLRVRSSARTVLLATPFLTIALYFTLRQIAISLGEYSWVAQGVLGMALARPGPILHMLLHLVRFGLVRLLAGAWLAGTTDPTVASWVALGAVATLLLVALARGHGETRRALIGTLGLCLATYGVIAFGRANYSEVVGVGVATASRTQRYHYAGSLSLAMLLTLLLAWLRREGRTIVVGAAAFGLVAAQAWAWRTHPIGFDLRPYVRSVVAQRLARAEAAILRAPQGDVLYLENEPLPPGVRGIFGPALIPGTAALVLIAHGGDRPLGRDVRFMEPDATIRAKYRAPESRWLSHLLVKPWVTLGGDGTRATRGPCELVMMKRLLRFSRSLLACERRALAPVFDVAHCRDVVVRTAERRLATPCRACIDPRPSVVATRKAVEGAHWLLRCAAGPEAELKASSATQRCGGANIRALDRLIRALFACHRRSIVRDHVVDDEACEARVVATYRRRVPTLLAGCGQCYGELLAVAAPRLVGDTVRDLFCSAR
jgi:hypothetical protein